MILSSLSYTDSVYLSSLLLSVIFCVEFYLLSKGLKRTSLNLGKSMLDTALSCKNTVKDLTKSKESSISSKEIGSFSTWNMLRKIKTTNYKPKH